jgi:GNAT superfamily N-acetyltransferase
MSSLNFEALTKANWPDFEKLFGPKGACAGCWCMWFRLKRSEWEALKGEGNRQAMKAIVDSGRVPGILSYQDEEPVAWCSIAPREAFPVLGRSRILKPPDEQPVWSIVCLFLHKRIRRKGSASAVVRAAVEYAQQSGASMVEAYPIDTPKINYPVAFAATGFYSTYQKAGFIECARRSETRPIMRYQI